MKLYFLEKPYVLNNSYLTINQVEVYNWKHSNLFTSGEKSTHLHYTKMIELPNFLNFLPYSVLCYLSNCDYSTLVAVDHLNECILETFQELKMKDGKLYAIEQ